MSNPVPGEIVSSDAVPLRARRLGALVLAGLPLLMRLAWWWWGRSRVVTPETREPNGLWEHTDLRLTKRPLGRWKVRVVTTRWITTGIGSEAPGGGDSGLGALARLSLLGLERVVRAPRPAAIQELPRLTSPDRRRGEGR